MDKEIIYYVLRNKPELFCRGYQEHFDADEVGGYSPWKPDDGWGENIMQSVLGAKHGDVVFRKDGPAGFEMILYDYLRSCRPYWGKY